MVNVDTHNTRLLGKHETEAAIKMLPQGLLREIEIRPAVRVGRRRLAPGLGVVGNLGITAFIAGLQPPTHPLPQGGEGAWE